VEQSALTHSANHRPAQDVRPRRLILARGLLLAALVLVLAWAVYVGHAAWSLRGHLSAAQTALTSAQGAEGDPQAAATACRAAVGLRGDVTALRWSVGPFLRIAPVFRGLPRIGGLLRAAPDLLIVADGLTETAALGCDALTPALAAGGQAGQGKSSMLEQLTAHLAGQTAQWQRAETSLVRARAAWRHIDPAVLPASIESKAALLDKSFPLLQGGAAAAVAAPQLLGADGPRTYLVLALNEDELRPAGGFITAIGEVRVSAGRVISMTFRDSYAVDDFSQPYPDPPEPLRAFMGIDLWVFRDSNWSPDFPTSARQALALYRPKDPAKIDGVLALDQAAVARLVAALGPLTIPGAEQPVTGDNLIAYIRHAWAPADGNLGAEWWASHKSFMGPLAQAAWQRVQAGEVDWTALGSATFALLQEKHLQVYLQDTAAAALLASQGWDGALRPAPGDYLAVNDANVGYNKVSPRIKESIRYAVDLRAAPPRGTLTIVQSNTNTAAIACTPEARYDTTYEQMMNRCYWDYFRIYAAPGSQLLDGTAIPVAAEQVYSHAAQSGQAAVSVAPEGPWTILAALSVLPPMGQQMRTYDLALPANVMTWTGNRGQYRLRVQKQAGAAAHDFELRVHLPTDATLADKPPAGFKAEGDWLIYHAPLDQDRDFQLDFTR
jgi:hypothetical protein